MTSTWVQEGGSQHSVPWLKLVLSRRGGTTAHQVEWQAVVGKGNGEEHQVDEQVEQICEKLQVKDVDALVLPTPLHVGVDAGQHILDECAAVRWRQLCQRKDVSAAAQQHLAHNNLPHP